MDATMITFYKLKHATDDTKRCYIGSTNDIKRRMKEHSREFNGGNKYGRLYGYMRRNGGWDAWTFEILETKECEMRRHRFTREGELIREHNATLNIIMPGNDVVDYEDERKQICGQCGKMLRIKNTSRKLLREHHATKKCQNATPPIILKGKNNTINITITKGKRPIIIKGDDNTLNIHYNID